VNDSGVAVTETGLGITVFLVRSAGPEALPAQPVRKITARDAITGNSFFIGVYFFSAPGYERIGSKYMTFGQGFHKSWSSDVMDSHIITHPHYDSKQFVNLTLTVMKVIDPKDLEPWSFLFRGRNGHHRAELAMRFLAIDKVNRVYENSGAWTGAEFTSRLLDDVGVSYSVGNAHRLRNLPEGPFITISNHPYGGLDGIMTIDMMARIRPDYKFMVNRILSLIKTLNGNFISVVPTGNKKTGIKAESIRGVRETIDHLHAGHPVGFFPSGAVSDLSLKDMKIRDRRWQESILHLIHSVRVPVLPIRFFDKNSAFFYFLGLINWRIRLLRLPSEVFNKKDRTERIGIGELINPEELAGFSNPASLGVFLRKKVYEMQMPVEFIPGKLI
jgi:putative hemolysin